VRACINCEYEAVIGYVIEDGDFVSACGDPTGWAACDYVWWMPLPAAPSPENRDER
jgi:hypothetical protein